jgi:hypothetical protein
LLGARLLRLAVTRPLLLPLPPPSLLRTNHLRQQRHMTSEQGDFVVSDDGGDDDFSMPISAKAKAAAKKTPAKSKVAGATKVSKATTKGGDAAPKKKKAEPLSRRKSNETAVEENGAIDEVMDLDEDRAGNSSSARPTPAPAAPTTKKSATQTYQKVSVLHAYRGTETRERY